MTELVQDYKHIFTSPSSVDVESKGTCSSNACLHGTSTAMKALIAYIATQVSILNQVIKSLKNQIGTFYLIVHSSFFTHQSGH